jgi:hypothetical protein
MVGVRLIRLVETHCDELAIGLTEKLRRSERTKDFRNIPIEELQQTAASLYQNLGEWLLKRTESDVEMHFVAIAKRRAAEGVRLPQFVWAVILSSNHLHHFLQASAFADTIVALYGELEVQQLLNQFFERAIYYGVVGYEEVREAERYDSNISPNRRKKAVSERTRSLRSSKIIRSRRIRNELAWNEH